MQPVRRILASVLGREEAISQLWNVRHHLNGRAA
jgi:hypothetical protein